MVAAAGDAEAVSVRTAVIALAVVVAGVIAVAFLGGKANLLQATPFDLPPAALEQKVSEVIRSFGYSDRPIGRASGFIYDEDVRQYGESQKDAGEYQGLLAKGSPAMIRFWYRQSPQYLEDPNNANIVTPSIPAPIQSGMVSVKLNPQGQLVELAAMPAQHEPAEPGRVSSSFDWRALFTAAGLDMSRFTPVQPDWLPPSAFDARAAWTGVYPGTAIPLRIEAASWRGRPVQFRMIGPWNPMSNTQPSDPRVRQGAFLDYVTYRIVFQVALLAIGCLFAWRNFRLGKGDLQGAFRLAAFVFLLHLAAWPFVTSWASDASEIDAIFNQLAHALFNAGILWTYYVALEPYVRRRWPQSLIAWSRLLAGGFRDPVVGANVLIGAANGVVISAYFLAAQPASALVFLARRTALARDRDRRRRGSVRDSRHCGKPHHERVRVPASLFPAARIAPQHVDRGGGLHLAGDVGDPTFAELPASFAGVELHPERGDHCPHHPLGPVRNDCLVRGF
jgi:serine/threonine-protein kinase